MAWSTDIGVGWIDAFESSGFKYQIWLAYRINVEERKVYPMINTCRVVSKGGQYAYSQRAQFGYQLLGGAAGEEYGTAFDETGTINCPAGSAWQRSPDAPVAMNYAYDSSGNLPTVRCAVHCIMDPAYASKQSYYLNQDWTEINLATYLPNLDADFKSPTNLSIDPNYTTVTSIKAQWVGNVNAVKYKATIKGGNVDTTIETTDTYYTFRNLDSNTSYKITVYGIDSDGNVSSGISLDTKTKSQSEFFINNEGTQAKGLVNVIVEDSTGTKKLKKAINIWVNVEGTAKKMV